MGDKGKQARSSAAIEAGSTARGRRPRLQPSIESIELYDRICDCIQTQKKETLKGVAHALGCALSAVSGCLKAWKVLRGVELVNLAASPIVLYPAGEDLHKMAKAVLAAHCVMRTPGPPGTGDELVIGAANVFVRQLLCRVTGRFYAQSQVTGTSIRFIEEREQAIRALEEGEAHFLLGGSGLQRRRSWLVWKDLQVSLDLVAITRKNGAPRAGLAELAEEDLEQQIVCLQEDDARLLRFPRRIVVTNYSSIMNHVREVGAVGIVPVLGGVQSSGLEVYRKDFRVFRLRLRTPMEPWNLGIWTRRNRTLSPGAEAYVNTLKTFIKSNASRWGASRAEKA